MNFKFGLQKHVFAFTDADFALFSPAENQWRMRLEARPVRTDTNISDTGTVKADISFERAEMLRDTVVHGKISWDRGQMGMITKLIYGRDRGWRGMLVMQSEISGSPAELHFTSAATLHDFRRYDIYTPDPMALSATCKGIASITSNAIPGFNCKLTSSAGSIDFVGNLGPGSKTYDFSMAGENISGNELVTLVRHLKKDIPQDVSATGSLNFSANFRKTVQGGERQWSGLGTTTAIVLKSSVLMEPITLKPLTLRLNTPGAPIPAPLGKPSKTSKNEPPELPHQFLTVLPFAMTMGEKLPASMEAQVGTHSYQIGRAHV